MSFLGEILLLRWRVMFVGILLLFSVVLVSCGSIPNINPAPPTATTVPDGPISVVVVDENGQPLSPALMEHVIVGVKDAWKSDNYDNDRFGIDQCGEGQFVSAWAPGYKVTFVPCRDGSFSYTVNLQPLKKNGSLYTLWMSAETECNSCHANEMAEWRVSGHATMHSAGIFETMYLGTSFNGNVSSSTEWAITDTGRVRLPAKDRDAFNYAGPGFRLDYPTENGNCGYCHIPTAQPGVNLSNYFPAILAVDREGITCDVCHKVLGVIMDDTGFPYEDRPGALSFTFLPQQDTQHISVGPLANTITSGGTFPNIVCSPVFSESKFCASCHYGKFYDMVIYNSYGEWRRSSYAERSVKNESKQDVENVNYRSCQDCHMLEPSQVAGKLPSERDACSASNLNFGRFNHNMMREDGPNQNLIRDAATLDVESEYVPETNSLRVIVKTTNVKAGHKFPTDSPLRHLILVVNATDEQNNLLTQINGGVIPNWGGVKPNPLPGMENYGGLPGKIFANLLVDKDTNLSPVSAYWNPTKHAWENPADGTSSDTRLNPAPAAGEHFTNTDESSYIFTIPSTGGVIINVRLVYRYAFIDLVNQKGWSNRADSNRPDVLVTGKNCTLNPTHPETLNCQDIPH